jgi:sortase A
MRSTRNKKLKPHELSYSRVKLSFKKHILPPVAGVFAMIFVFALFNAQYLSGQIAYKIHASQTTSATELPAESVYIDKNMPPRIIINKIDLEAPVIYDLINNDEDTFQKALQDGTVHYPGTAKPGEPGNVAIFGHSSGAWWAPGDYKFVFTLLEKLEAKDTIILDYDGVRHIYRVTDTRVVSPEDVSVLQPTANSKLTLITCTPVGTNEKRLIIDAEQIVPKPATNPNDAIDQSRNQPQNNKTQTLPSSAPPSMWETLRNLF